MYTRPTFICKLSLQLVALLAIGVSVLASTDDITGVTGVKSINFGPVGNSFVTPFDDPSKSGISTSSVNLYTGQHAESFPLAAVQGRGGLGATLSLDYNGNVRRLARSENRLAQASECGLGFDLGLQSIIVEHGGTACIDDDRYRMVIGTSSLELRAKDDGSYVTQNGDPWIIHRDTAVIAGRTCVIGWTVIREDGTVYRFGDHTNGLTGWNATRNLLRYGSFVGSGVTLGDTVYASAWDLKAIHDADSLNWVSLVYTQEAAHLRVTSADGSTVVNSDHSYTRSSHISEIATSGGDRIVLKYANREDFQLFHGVNCYEFFQTKRLDTIEVQNGSGAVISRLLLGYQYLNNTRDSVFKKLLLTSITRQSGDGSLSTPPLRFDYDADTASLSFGAIRQIVYPSGAFRHIEYTQVDSGKVLTRLDRTILDTDVINKQYVSDNLVLSRVDSSWSVAYWNGYWDVKTFNASDNARDLAGVSPDSWFVVPRSASSGILQVWRWKGGYWESQTLSGDLAVSREEGLISLYTGKDCFIAVTGPIAQFGDVHGRGLLHAYYFRWDGVSWHKYLFRDMPITILLGVKFSGDVWTLATTFGGENAHNNFVYGAYDRRNDTVVTGEIETVHTTDWRLTLDRFGAGVDFVAFIDEYSLHTAIWQDAAWGEWTSLGSDGMTSFCTFANGAAMTFRTDYPPPPIGGGPRTDSLVSVFRAPTGFVTVHQSLNGVFEDRIPLWGAQHSLVTREHNTPGQEGTAILWMWNGREWQINHQILAGEAQVDQWPELYADRYLFGAAESCPDTYYCRLEPSTYIYARAYLGSQQWSSSAQMILATMGYTSAENAIVGRTYTFDSSYQSRVDVHLLDRFSDREHYFPHLLETVDTGTFVRVFGAGDIFCIKNTILSTDSMPFGPGCYGDSLSLSRAFKIADNEFLGKPRISAISKITTGAYLGDPDSVIQEYNYFGALLDERATTPRFCRAEVSTPYYASEGTPVGYSVHCFYNDIDTTGFFDASVYDSVQPPDLKSATRYGAANGGYRLDGMEYLSYSYTVGDEPGVMQDSTRSFYRLHRVAEDVDDVYRVLLDSVHTRTDSLAQDVKYTYDTANYQLTATRTSYLTSNCYLVDSTEYAFHQNTTMVDDNALVQASAHRKYLDSAGTSLRCLGRDSTVWERHGSWRPIRTYSWRNVTDESSIILTSSLLPGNQSFDEFGNIIAFIGPSGDTSCVKLDESGLRPVASASQCYPGDLLVQDFEQGDGWDDWAWYSLGLVGDTSSASVHTGKYSLLITDPDPGDMTMAGGPQRVIYADSLSDSLYLLSTWVRANNACAILVMPKDQTDNTLDTMALSYTPTSPISNVTWKKIEKLFTIKRTYGGQSTHHVLIAFIAQDAAFDTNYVYFDDFRFHRLSASVGTTIFDPAAGRIVAQAGPDNVPSTTTYDALGRPVVSMRDATVVGRTNYFVAQTFTGDSLLAQSDDPETGGDSREVTLEVSQPIRYRLQLERSYTGGIGTATVSLNGVAIDELECDDDCDLTRMGEFMACSGDTIRVSVNQSGGAQKELEPPPQWHYKSNIWFADYEDNTANPSYVMTTTYGSGQDSTLSVSFTDGLGRVLQTRTRNPINGVDSAIVSGPVTYDARGRVLKAYKPYQDNSGATGYLDYSTKSSSINEVLAYYDGSPGPDCDNFPYSEKAYSSEFKSKLESSSSPGPVMNMGSGHVTRYKSFTRPQNGEVVSGTCDPDNITDSTVADRWGRWSKKISPYHLTGGGMDSIVTISFQDLVTRTDSVVLDTTGGTPITLRRAYRNDLGLDTLTWKVDYGKIRMIYDDAGNLRFMQNEKRQAESTFVYFKYDRQGRKIEEGVKDSASTYMGANAQAWANDLDFPRAPNNPTVNYKWTYDFWASGSDTSLAPGKLVRLQNAAGDYYKKFYYYPTGDSDKTIVKLQAGSPKAIKHFYNRDGSLKRLEVWRNASDVSTRRAYDYQYDAAGRLVTIVNGDLNVARSRQQYARYSYNPDGSLRQTMLGIYDNTEDLQDVVHDTIQVLDYVYSPEGRLLGVNQPVSAIARSLTGKGAANDHFGQALTYFDEQQQAGYFNGRLYENVTVNSKSGDTVTHRFQYYYNDLGWLTKADHETANQYDESFSYDALGRRLKDSLGTTTTPVTYTYDNNSPGSSRLLRTSSMAAGKTMKYDILGNLVEDSSRSLYQMNYDYRNLLTYTKLAPNVASAPNSWLDLTYDETGNRISKLYHYQVLLPCDTGIGGEMMLENAALGVDTGEEQEEETIDTTLDLGASGGATTLGFGGGGGTTWCLSPASTGTYYLYDGGVLVATFDSKDSVIDMFVNGPQGRIATYASNKNEYLYYFLPDHLGSMRVMMRGALSDTIKVAQYWNYRPFGQTIDSWGSFATPYKFTGKEEDACQTFNFVYFGARYYDPQLGAFSTPDMAGQFANGYVYGANNPISMVDRDGNLAWFIPLLLGAVMNTGMNCNSIDNLGDFGKFAAIGAISGSLGAGAGNIIGNAVKVGGFVGGAASGAAGGFAGGFAGSAGNAWATNSDFGEGLVSGLKGGAFGAVSGAAIGGIVGGINAKLKGGDFWNGKEYLNEFGGGSKGVQLDETIPSGGKPTATGEIAKHPSNPKYGQYGPGMRDGGLTAHNGVDYAGMVGDDVYAMYDGKVTMVGTGPKLGRHAVRTTAMINGQRWNVDYGHLSEACVRVNDIVVTGDQVGLMGRLGYESPKWASMPTHVHIQVWRTLENDLKGFVMPSWKRY